MTGTTSEPAASGGEPRRFKPLGRDTRRQWRGLIEEYAPRLPVTPETPIVTLREGGTPLIRSEQLSELTGCEVWLKFDGANPTGSFKDRGMTLAISKAVEAGAEAVICASTGNTSASAAAYAAKAGLVCGVLIPKGKIALGKLAQALVHGAQVIQVDGNFDVALEICRTLDEKYPVELVNSVNPYRIEGQKTAAFEVCDFLGRAPDVHVMPVGNAGNITAYWQGYNEYAKDGLVDSLPVLRGFQAAGAAPIVEGRVIESPSTIATAIRIGNPASWDRAVAAADESSGSIRAVTDRDILKAYRLVAKEGVFCEMASAASIAGLLQLAGSGDLDRGQTAVCVLTGHGLKEPDWAIAGAAAPPVISPDVDAAAELLGLGR
ncbi:MAG TPA: threonine synthase [Egibacteraceae bacterium]|nr:threonine synthase [Egibacteraceae bacterium]